MLKLKYTKFIDRIGAVHKLDNAFFTVFDHPPTHSNALAIILLMTYNTRVCYSNAFANHPPTPPALRNK